MSSLILQSCRTISVEEIKTMQTIIPKPLVAEQTTGYFEFEDEVPILVDPLNQENQKVAEYLADKLKASTGFNVQVLSAADYKGEKSILLSTLDKDEQLEREGYLLSITNSQVKLSANTAEGLFRGIQTIRQLFPPSIENNDGSNSDWIIPAGVVRDKPRYEWRGAMLDVARHFFSVEDVKKYIDALAYYKINKFHMHLTDDQGWRIEIKSWPKLTEIGGSSSVNNENPGFYTQEEFSEIVKYAHDRYIELIPEIDMPGHTNAALASYAGLNCNDQAPPLYTGIKVGFSSLCLDKEITYKFVDDVIREVSALVPGKYFHVGGDEAHATDSSKYVVFIEKVQDIVNKYGKQMIGWEEIAQSKLKTSSMAQLWRNKLALKAAEQGCKIILSPSPKIYIDMKYDSTTTLGLYWAGFIEVDKAYNWEPAEYVEGLNPDAIIGVEAPLWAETIKTVGDIEFLAFPRIIGVAELGWSAKDNRNWDEYKKRLGAHALRLEGMNINYYKSPLVDWVE
jgi:hexosaminidase